MKTIVLRNSAKCLKCDTEVQSAFRHDFVKCECGDVFVDGGYDYIRHGFKSEDTYVNTSLTEDTEVG